MKVSKFGLIVALVAIAGCANLSSERKFSKAEHLIREFYNAKSLYTSSANALDSVLFYERQYNDAFDSVLAYKNEVMPYLIQCRWDSSFSFYASLKKYPPSWGPPNENRVNALFLIEAIIRENSIFNRGENNQMSRQAKLGCEALNTVYDTTRINPISTIDFFYCLLILVNI